MEKSPPETDHSTCDWKVIELVSGQILAIPEAICGDRPALHEVVIWQGGAQSEAEALQKAAQADQKLI